MPDKPLQLEGSPIQIALGFIMPVVTGLMLFFYLDDTSWFGPAFGKNNLTLAILIISVIYIVADTFIRLSLKRKRLEKEEGKL